MIVPDMEFDIMWEDKKIGHVKIEDEKVVCAEQDECKPWERLLPMVDKIDIPLMSRMLELRCWERGRDDIREILDYLGIEDYNPFLIVQKTHGTDYDDKQWLRFKGETLTWADVNPRRERH